MGLVAFNKIIIYSGIEKSGILVGGGGAED
jgi:hypothetical protein